MMTSDDDYFRLLSRGKLKLFIRVEQHCPSWIVTDISLQWVICGRVNDELHFGTCRAMAVQVLIHHQPNNNKLETTIIPNLTS